MTRTTVTLAGALALALALASCAEPLPEPTPDPLPAVTQPAVSVEQVERVLDDLGDVLAAADEQRSSDALAPRVAESARYTRRAQYTLAGAGVENAVTAVPTEAQTVLAPVVEGWPRTVMVVTEPPEDLQAPLLLTLVQASPREQFTLQGWARLFPERETPPVAQPEIGSEPAEGLDLLVPLDELVPRYVDVVAKGPRSEHAETFAEDPLRAGIQQARDAYEGLTAETGSFGQALTPVEGSVHALATADGGAIVTAAFTTLATIELEDSTMTVDEATAALLGGTTELEERLQITWLSMVAFHVPPAGSDEPVQVLGGEHVRAAASGA